MAVYFYPVKQAEFLLVNLPVADTSPKINNLDEAEAAGAIYQAFELQIRVLQIRKNRLERAAQRRGKQIDELRRRQDKQSERLKAWSEEQKVMEGKAQLVLRHVTLNSKLGNPAIVPMKNWTDKLCLAAMRMGQKVKKFGPFIRTKYEIDRQAILKDSKADKPILKLDALAGVGLEIKQEKYFWVEPRLDQ